MKRTNNTYSQTERAKNAHLDQLQAHIATLEAKWAAESIGAGGNRQPLHAIPMGCADIDHVLPGGLPQGSIHEISGRHMGPLQGLASIIAKKFQDNRRESRLPNIIIWIHHICDGTPYPPGLFAFGLTSHDVIFARVSSKKDTISTVEDALRSGQAGLVIVETDHTRHTPDLMITRRWHLAAAAGRSTLLQLHRTPETTLVSSAATTRWHISAMTTANSSNYTSVLSPDQTRWSLCLKRLRRFKSDQNIPLPITWTVEWIHATHHLCLATAHQSRPLAPSKTATVWPSQHIKLTKFKNIRNIKGTSASHTNPHRYDTSGAAWRSA